MENYWVILAAGHGTRLWPISRKFLPKQFVKLKELNNISLYQRALKKCLEYTKSADNIKVVLTYETIHHWINQANELWIKIDESNLIIQPSMKETQAIISWAFKEIPENSNALIMASDHIIESESFRDEIELNKKNLEESMILFWIKWEKAETWLWYIEPKNPKEKISQISSFKEKPEKKEAEKFIKKWFLYNSMIFVSKKEVYMNELKKINHKMYDDLVSSENIGEFYEKCEKVVISQDIFEKSKNLLVQRCDFWWTDLWDFDSIKEFLEKSWYKDENSTQINSSSNMVLKENDDKRVCLLWVDNLTIIDKDDVLLVMKQWEWNNIKKLVKKFEEKNENHTDKLDFWRTMYRPWGYHTTISEEAWYRVRKITIFPWKALSLQKHMHRDESWVVASWIAEFINGKSSWKLEKWESTFIKHWNLHKLSNPWKVNLEVIETQIWDYLIEDDIIRFSE